MDDNKDDYVAPELKQQKKARRLPTKKTPKKTSLSDLTILLYGKPKIGKSSFASQFPQAIFHPTEPGLNSLEVFQSTDDPDSDGDSDIIRTWAELSQMLSLVALGGHDFKTNVIDTIGNAYEFCAKHVCDKRNIEYAGDLAHGKGWGLIKSEFKRLLTAAAGLPYGLLLIAHATEEKDVIEGVDRLKTQPTLSKACREVLLGMVDMILYFDVEKVQGENGETYYDRVLRTKPSTTFEAGDRTNTLPSVIRVPNSQGMSGPEHSAKLFKLFRAAFEKGNNAK